MQDEYDLSKLVKNKKKRLNSKNKGNTFQRKVAQMFNEHFGTDQFAPTPGSGAFATTHSLPKHLQIYGDLITPQNFCFVLECKKGYNNENIGSTFSKKSLITEALQQADRDAKKCAKIPMVVFQQDRKDILCIIPYKKFHAPFLNNLSYYISLKNEYLIIKLKELLNLYPQEAIFWIMTHYWYLEINVSNINLCSLSISSIPIDSSVDALIAWAISGRPLYFLPCSCRNVLPAMKS